MWRRSWNGVTVFSESVVPSFLHDTRFGNLCTQYEQCHGAAAGALKGGGVGSRGLEVCILQQTRRSIFPYVYIYIS